MTFKDEFQNNTGLFVEQATYPARRRNIFLPDPADVPDRIQYDALSGTHVIDNTLGCGNKRAQIVDHRHISTGTNEPTLNRNERSQPEGGRGGFEPAIYGFGDRRSTS